MIHLPPSGGGIGTYSSNLISHGSFDSPVVPSNSTITGNHLSPNLLTGWTINYIQQLRLINGTGSGLTPPPNNSQFLIFIGSVPFIQQTVNINQIAIFFFLYG